MDFFLSELELVIVSGLDMYTFYSKLENYVIRMDGIIGGATSGGPDKSSKGKTSIDKENVKNIKISGARLLRIFDDSYEKMSTPQFDPDIHFPQQSEGRNYKQNVELILTTLIIYRQGFMTVTEIQNTMDLFKKFTMKKILPDGRI